MKTVIKGWKRRKISNENKNERKKLNKTAPLRVNNPGIVPNSTLTEQHLNQQKFSSHLFKEILFERLIRVTFKNKTHAIVWTFYYFVSQIL